LAAKVEADRIAQTEKDAAVKSEAERIAQSEKDAAVKAEAERIAQAEKDAAVKAEAERVAQAEKDAAVKAEAEKAGTKVDATKDGKTAPDKTDGAEQERDRVKVAKGMGYWDVAAQMLGYTDGSGRLKSSRHHINTDLTGEDRAKIYKVMDELRRSKHDDFRSSKLRPGEVLHRPK